LEDKALAEKKNNNNNKEITKHDWFFKEKKHDYEVIHTIIGYLFGTAASYSFTIIAKFTIGRMRPHFLDLCRPNFQEIDCGTEAHPLFVTKYVCQGNPFLADILTENDIREAYVSFMSGHACLIFQAATFLALYFQARLNCMNTFVVPSMQLACIAFAFWVALTRVKDHMHHPGDVIAGAIVGTLIQIFNVFSIVRLFARKEPAFVIKN